MHLPRYQLNTSLGHQAFEFVSVGIHEKIVKRVEFSRIGREHVFNLAFGDKNPDTSEMDDVVVTNNGDSETVLATVVSAVFAFLEREPDAWVFAAGSTPARTRLYQMSISRYLEVGLETLEIFGMQEGRWCRFQRNESYAAFLIGPKIV